MTSLEGMLSTQRVFTSKWEQRKYLSFNSWPTCPVAAIPSLTVS
jgi:hypothetical protein